MTQPEPIPGTDPSMEDILASIRRILADGDGEAEAGAFGREAGAAGQSGPMEGHQPEGYAAPAAYAPPPAYAPPSSYTQFAPHHPDVADEPARSPDDDVFLLDQTMLIEEPAPMQPEPHVHRYANEPVAAAQPEADFSHLDAGDQPSEPLLAPSAAAATTASLGALVRVVQRQTQAYHGGPTLEDMVREEIRPMVKAWLDEHLAPMVERMVRAEIDRVSNRNG